MPRVGNFRQKNNSAEDGTDGTNGYFRRNSGCSAEQKTSEFRSESFRERENNTEIRSVEQKMKQTLGIPFRTLPRKRKKRFINQNDQGDEMEGLEMGGGGKGDDLNGESLKREGVKELYTLFQPK